MSDATPRKVDVFLCYRQVDGDRCASLLFDSLNGASYTAYGGAACVIRPYLDRRAPGVADWTTPHQQALEAARAFIFILTPGSRSEHSGPRGSDVVFRELRWWLDSRTATPIVVDTIDDGEKWLPSEISTRWPRLNRILLTDKELDAQQARGTKQAYLETLRARIIDTIQASEHATTLEDLQRLKEAQGRLRLALRACLGLACLALIVAGFAWGLKNRVREQHRKAVNALLVAESQNELSRRYDRAVLIAAAAARREPTADARRALLAALNWQPRIQRILRGHVGSISSIAFGSDGRQLVTGGDDGAVLRWNLHEHPAVPQPIEKGDEAVHALAVHADGTVAFARAGAAAVVRASNSGTPTTLPCHEAKDASVLALAFGQDSEVLIAGLSNGEVRGFSFRSKRCTLMGQHEGKVRTIAADTDRGIVSAGDDGTLLAWRPGDGQPCPWPHEGDANREERSPIGATAFTEDGILAAAGRGLIQISEVPALHPTGACRLKLLEQPVGQSLVHEQPIRGLACGSRGQNAVTVSADSAVLWGPPPERAPTVLTGEGFTAVAFHPDGGTFAIGDSEGVVTLWSVDERRAIRTDTFGEGTPVSLVGWLEDGTVLTVDERFGMSARRAHDLVSSRAALATDSTQDSLRIEAAALSPGRRRWVSWDGRELRLSAVARSPFDSPAPLVLKHCGSRGKPPDIRKLEFTSEHELLGLCRDGYVVRWREKDGGWQEGEIALEDPVREMAAAAKAGLFVTATKRKVEFWRSAAQSDRLREVAFTDAVGPDGLLSMASDGSLAASVHGADAVVQLWWPSRGHPAPIPIENLEHIDGLAISPDGALLAVTGREKRCAQNECRYAVVLVDARVPSSLGVLGRHAQRVRRLAFSTDGLRLVAGGDDGSVVAWTIDVESWVREACQIANDRELSDDTSSGVPRGWSSVLSDLPPLCVGNRSSSAGLRETAGGPTPSVGVTTDQGN